MKKILSVILMLAIMLSSFALPTFAAGGDDNAHSGDGNTHNASKGYGWYSSRTYMWKVSLYVGKSDRATKQSSLRNDFYCVGVDIIKNTGWNLNKYVLFAKNTKVSYYSGKEMKTMMHPHVLADSNCPKIPIACSGGNINTVKSYFGSTGTINMILKDIASCRKTTPYDMLKKKYFDIGGQNKNYWPSEYLLPNATTNRVPWVIVYEPIIIMHLKDGKTQVAFTATEYALAQKYGWYDWKYSGGKGQRVNLLTHRHLPMSVQLEESWFGYPAYNVTTDRKDWKEDDIIKGGGWGMRWLNAAIIEKPQIDYGCYFNIVDEATAQGYGNVEVVWKNYKPIIGTVLCELYRDNTCIWSGYKTFDPGQSITQSYNVYYPNDGTVELKARINYANRNKETDPSDNERIDYAYIKSKNNIDYGVYFINWPNPQANSYDNINVCWRNYKDCTDTVYCILEMDERVIWSGYKTLAPYDSIEETYSVYFSGDQERYIAAYINYDNRFDEADPNDNMASGNVVPTPEKDETYDFSVSNLVISPDPLTQGQYAKVSFISDNWNRDKSYSNILIEVLANDTVVKSEYVSFEAYGRNSHEYYIPLEKLGTNNIDIHINWANRFLESRYSNNETSNTVDVIPNYEFSVSNLTVRPSEAFQNSTVTVSFITDNWDRFNSYKNIPVEILFDGNVIKTEEINYEPYARKNHTVTVNVGNQIGVHSITVRVNWPDHNKETNPYNNISDAETVNVKENNDLGIQYIQPNSSYKAGMTVITSYRIYNYGSKSVTPAENNTVYFEAYYYDSSIKKVVSSQTVKQAVIPGHDNNLVWFKWTVPDIAAHYVYCRATINSDNTIIESTKSNNVATLILNVDPVIKSQTPDTHYERKMPEGFTKPRIPGSTHGQAKWSVWEYENGGFVKKTYAVGISSVKPSVIPDRDAKSAAYKNGDWQMASGYGFEMKYAPTNTYYAGYEHAPSSSYTFVQSVSAYFPEFKYSNFRNKYRTLEKKYNMWQFAENPFADGKERLHFTPIWYPNGVYCVSTIASECWTPAGMIASQSISNNIKIVDSAYDDWYVGK